jgi:RimJ/RimL family protein N-acetyltransferase
MVEHGRGLGARRMESYCHADHLASARVLEKAGLHLVRIARDELVFPNFAPTLQDVREYALDY